VKCPINCSDAPHRSVKSTAMTGHDKNETDRRIKRTKALVFEAFFQMVQSCRYDGLKTKDLIQKAGVGRSTFYEHFGDKGDVLSQSLEYPMSIFASALTGKVDDENLLFILTHFWERRMFARIILQHPTRAVVDNCLRVLILKNLRTVKDDDAHASFLTSGYLSLLNDWLTGRINCDAKDMSEYIKIYAMKHIDT